MIERLLERKIKKPKFQAGRKPKITPILKRIWIIKEWILLKLVIEKCRFFYGAKWVLDRIIGYPDTILD